MVGFRKASVYNVQIGVFYTTEPDDDRVCFAGRSIELRSDGVFPTAHPGAPDGRPGRGIVVASTGDLGDLADSGSVPLSVIAYERAGHLYAREGA